MEGIKNNLLKLEFEVMNNFFIELKKIEEEVRKQFRIKSEGNYAANK